MNDTSHCYAVRRLNPFLGVMEVVEIAGARALSSDGRHWQIQVEAVCPDHTWRSDAAGHAQTRFFRFGDWSADQGLSRVPANPLLDIGAMQTASERLIAALQEALPRLPFPFTDRFEHWLLDTDGQPLALLATTVARRFTADIRVAQWQADTTTAADVVAADLERQVLAAAGPAARRCWYERQEDGRGIPLDAGCDPLPADAFPRLPLRSRWPDPVDQARVRDYLHRLAPQLLTLDGLDTQLRRELEQAACRQALQLADHYGLYPHVLQPALLDAARVEARLRRAAS